MSDRMWARVKLRVTVELLAPGSYGDEWRVNEMFEQCEREGIQTLKKLLDGNANIVGEPELQLITGYRKEPKL